MTQTNPKLRFGLWYAFRNPPRWRRSYQDVYAEILEQIVWAEGLGYDDVWLTEHHFAPALGAAGRPANSDLWGGRGESAGAGNSPASPSRSP